VGGDFYDLLELEDGHLGIVVGDATGKGVPAALVMASARSMLRAVAQASEWASPGKTDTLKWGLDESPGRRSKKCRDRHRTTRRSSNGRP
jgi:hypothetical protein